MMNPNKLNVAQEEKRNAMTHKHNVQNILISEGVKFPDINS